MNTELNRVLRQIAAKLEGAGAERTAYCEGCGCEMTASEARKAGNGKLMCEACMGEAKKPQLAVEEIRVDTTDYTNATGKKAPKPDDFGAWAFWYDMNDKGKSAKADTYKEMPYKDALKKAKAKAKKLGSETVYVSG